MLRSPAAVCTSLLLLALVAPRLAMGAAVWYQATPLGLPAGGYTSLEPTDMNDQGQIVGYAYTATTTRGFSWIDGQFTLLAPLTGNFSYADAVNNLGQIVGTSQNEDGIPKAAFWETPTASPIELITSGGRSANAYATGINDNAQVSGFFTTSGSGNVNSWEAVRWVRDERGRFDATALPQVVPPVPGVFTAGYDINNQNVIVGSGPTPDLDVFQAPTLWEANNTTQVLASTMPDLFVQYQARAINDQGVIVGWATDSIAQGYALRWETDRSLTILGRAAGAIGTEAHDINASGMIIGTAWFSDGTSRAVSYVDGAWIDLTDSLAIGDGWILQAAEAINDSGQIVGYGTHNGVAQTFVLAPGAAPLVGDYDRNGFVDTLDWNVWRNDMGSTTSLAADGNGDGIVDAADYTIWRDNLPGTLAASPAGVPEPASWIALAIAAGGFAFVPKSLGRD